MADRAPIPPPVDADPEDVFWALSTATTLYNRGEHAEALKWLRRAAQQASDQGADERALVLMKAAADLMTSFSVPPPAPSVAPPPRPSAPPPLPKRAAPPAPPRPPSVPAAPPPVPSRPAPPSVPAPPRAPAPPASAPKAAPQPPAPRASLPSKPGNTRRERAATMSGKRGGAGAKRAEPAKAARTPSVPEGIPDAPIDDLDEVTSVIDRRLPPPPAAPSPKARKAVLTEDALVANKPIVAPAKSAALPVKPSAASAKQAPTSTSKPAEPAPQTPAPAVARAPLVRKSTMALVDEGFESMLSGDSAPVVPFMTPAAAPEPPQPAPATGLLAQRVAVIAGPNGEARIVALADLASLPEGAIAAVVVPLAASDGEPLARLLARRRPV